MKKTKTRGMWKRTLGVLTKFNVPWHLYLLQIILTIIDTEIALKYIPYYSALQTGDLSGENLTGYLLFSLISMAVSFINSIPVFYARNIVNRNLQKKMTFHALTIPMNEYEKNSSKMVSWITNDAGDADGLIGVITGFFTGVVSIFMSMNSIGGLDSSMIMFVPVMVLIIILFTWIEGKLLFIRQKSTKTSNASMTAYYSEHLSFLTQIKQSHSEDTEFERGKREIKDYYRSAVKEALLTLLNNFTSGSLQNIVTLLIFIVGVPMVNNGKFTLAELAAFQNFVLLAYASFQSIPSSYTSMMYYNGNLYYIGNMLATKSEVIKRNTGMDMEDEDIVFDNVSFSYDEDKQVLKNTSFSIEKGKVTLVVGTNGSGKSTIFKLLERFYTPDNGSIRFGNHNVEDIHLDEWRQSIAYVQQEPQLFNGTVRDNITYGLSREVFNDEIEAAAKFACADQFINELENGYDFVIGDNGEKLSAGQRQRLAIARAVMLDPAYLLLDEATCNMDIISEKAVTEALLKLMKDRTTVIISHDMRTLDIADNVLVVNNGEIEAFGSRDEVKKSSETLKLLMNS